MSQERIQRGVRGVRLNPPLNNKFHFHGKFWINLINLGYRIYPKYSHPLLFTLYFSLTSTFHYLRMCIKLLDEWQTVQTPIKFMPSIDFSTFSDQSISNITGVWLVCFITMWYRNFCIEYSVDLYQTPRSAIWVYTVCQCPFYETLVINGFSKHLRESGCVRQVLAKYGQMFTYYPFMVF